MILEAYAGAGASFVETVACLGLEAWPGPAPDERTVQDLTCHANRGWEKVEAYLNRPCEAAERRRPVEYCIRAAATTGHPAMAIARDREAGQALGPNPGAAVRDTAEGVLARVGREAEDDPLVTPVEGMSVID